LPAKVWRRFFDSRISLRILMRGSERAMLDTTVALGILSIALVRITGSTKSVLFTRSQFIGLVYGTVVVTPIRKNFQTQNMLEKTALRMILWVSKIPESRINIISVFVD
jgi:hypothetical protein